MDYLPPGRRPDPASDDTQPGLWGSNPEGLHALPKVSQSGPLWDTARRREGGLWDTQEPWISRRCTSPQRSLALLVIGQWHHLSRGAVRACDRVVSALR
jgi:hypothetical protein